MNIILISYIIILNDTQDGVLDNVWDGRIWNEFKFDPTDHTRPFLNNKNNLRLLIHVDWFKPLKQSEYKVAALMLTVRSLVPSPSHVFQRSTRKSGRPGQSGDVIGRGLGRGCASPPTRPRNPRDQLYVYVRDHGT